jgi:hypothetical protein
MSSQLASIVPSGPLTDSVFPFNKDAFIEIRRYQEQDLAFLSSPLVAAFVGTGDVVGGVSTAVVGGVGKTAIGVGSALFGAADKVASGLHVPGSGLFHKVGQGAIGLATTTEAVAEQLVDPTRVAREHYHYSNDVKQALPPAIDAVDELIHDFSSSTGHVVQELYENIPTKGLQITADLINRLAKVDKALADLYAVLTKNNIQEGLVVGQDKYKGVDLKGQKNYLQELSANLPEVLKTVQDVKGAFAAISKNLDAAQSKIRSGVTDPNQIFAQSHEVVVDSWKSFEIQRKTMTYLPYKY